MTVREKQLERELAAKEEQLQRACATGGIALWEWNTLTDALQWTGRASFLMKCKGAQLPHSMPELLSLTPPDDLPTLKANLERQLDVYGHIDIETRIVRPDHTTGWWRILSFAAQDTGHKPQLVSGACVDITSVMEHQLATLHTAAQLDGATEKLRMTREIMLQAERLHALRQMAGVIVHDLNGTLMPILGHTTFILSFPDTLDDRTRLLKAIKDISVAGENARRIIRQLKEFCRNDDDKSEFGLVELGRVVQSAIDLTKPKWQQRSDGLRESIEVLAELHDTDPVAGNTSQLREMSINLIINSVEAMPDGGTIVIRTFTAEGRSVLEIADTGEGMSEDVLAHCLDPFFTTKGRHGTGMGLAVVKRVVDRHHGDIAVKSVIGKGTKFTLNFPVYSTARVDQPDVSCEL